MIPDNANGLAHRIFGGIIYYIFHVFPGPNLIVKIDGLVWQLLRIQHGTMSKCKNVKCKCKCIQSYRRPTVVSTQAYCSFLLLFSKSVRSLGVGACAEVHEVYRLLNGSQSGEGGWELSMRSE